MHRIFTADDILLHIMEAVSASVWLLQSILDRRSLVAMAQVSRSFSDAALTILWRECESLVPLLELFPPETWARKERKDVRRHSQFYFVRPLHPNSWSRFERYAALVKTLTVNSVWEKIDLINVLQHLLIYRVSSGPLLPNLCSLSTIENERNAIHLCKLFLGPGTKLSSIELDFRRHFGWEGDIFLASVPILCPDLEALSLKSSFCTLSKENTGALSSLACNLSNLRKISVHVPLFHHAWAYLISHPKLVEVQLNLSHFPGSLSQQHLFPSLETLDLLAQRSLHETVLHTIQNISSRHLLHVSVCASTEDLTGETLWNYSEAIATVASDTLLDLCFSCIPVGHEPPEYDTAADYDKPFGYATEFPAHIRCLQPLHTAGQLKKLVYRVHNLDIDDEGICLLASWFPELTVVDLTTRDRLPVVTLRGVVSFIGRCRKLEKLGVMLDAKQEPPHFYSPLGDDSVNNVFCDLDVSNSPISIHDTARIAMALFTVAPRLRHISSSPNDMQDSDRTDMAWSAVESCLEAIGWSHVQWNNQDPGPNR